MIKFAILLSSIGCLLNSCTNKTKVGYVNTQKLFNGFKYKQELEKELNASRYAKKFIIDSMETSLIAFANRLSSNRNDKTLSLEFSNKKEMFLVKRKKFEEEEEELVKQFDEKIIRQLNAYTKQFGSEHKFDMIYGANSSGNIMYADSLLDLTPQIINYINEKYTGKKQ